jgi:hypothetical protein
MTGMDQASCFATLLGEALSSRNLGLEGFVLESPDPLPAARRR